MYSPGGSKRVELKRNWAMKTAGSRRVSTEDLRRSGCALAPLCRWLSHVTRAWPEFIHQSEPEEMMGAFLPPMWSHFDPFSFLKL